MYMFILICCAHVGDGKLLLTSFIRIMWLLADPKLGQGDHI
ncbi:unnamed protein product [Musa acuminata subsp. malaccensis]|uniref:(wild Malaysian banana) hypothetical protein n=1 Tax=Musa acuminata subsp. malaccensis TaxID=214687 RepID=A0A804K0C3_MUSAM|nr:unnamed protein product [Musa acuminata subsp. malaccensis]